MPGFPKPGFSYNYQTASQINALRVYRDTKPGRGIPPKHGSRVLVTTWNIANFGVHERRDKDHRLITELVSWFDLVAVQEVNNNLDGLTAVRSELPSSYRTVFSDKAGNNERMAYLYNSNKLTLLEEVGQIDVPPRVEVCDQGAGVETEVQRVRPQPLPRCIPLDMCRYALVAAIDSLR
jgi:hypothetical protein